MYKKTKIIASLVLVLTLIAGTGQADNYVTIGDPGNAPDTTGDGTFGSVGYVYRIGMTEVSIAQYLARPGASGGDYWSGVDTDNAPVANITWHQAAQYCNWLTLQGGNTRMPYLMDSGSTVTGLLTRAEMLADGGMFYVMPTEDEWYKAAYYIGNDNYTDYATGNTAPVNGFDAMFGTNTVWTVGEGNLEQNQTLNMMGNVFEWLETPIDYDLTLDGSPENMAFRGGAGQWPGGDGDFGNDRLHREYRAEGIYINGSGASQPNFYEDVGLRVVAIPEPGTLSLMSVSTIGLFLTRSIRRRKKMGRTLFPVSTEHLCDTYCTQEEWEAAFNEAGDPDGLDIAGQLLQAKMVDMWSRTCAAYKLLDQKFWNYMVVSHERHVVRKKAFRSALKKKALNGFDAFLALIMK